MRARTIYPLLFSGLFLLLTTFLMFWGSSPTPGWASGSAWTDLQGPNGGPAQAIAINPDYPGDQTVLAGGGHDLLYASWKGYGIFRSLDGGASWSPPGGPTDGALLDVAFSPRWHNDGMAVAGLWQGFWITHDRGATWQQLSGDDIGAPGWVGAVAISSPAPGEYTMLAGGAWGGLYRSVDQGVTWSTLFDPGGVTRILFDPFAPTIAWAAAGQGLWRSTDGGLQWTRVTTATTAYDVALDLIDGSSPFLTAAPGTAPTAADGTPSTTPPSSFSTRSASAPTDWACLWLPGQICIAMTSPPTAS